MQQGRDPSGLSCRLPFFTTKNQKGVDISHHFVRLILRLGHDELRVLKPVYTVLGGALAPLGYEVVRTWVVPGFWAQSIYWTSTNGGGTMRARIAMWAIDQAVVLAIVYLAVIDGSTGAGRVLIFTVWICVLIMIPAVALVEDGDDELCGHFGGLPRSIQRIDSITNIAVAMLLVWHGWWVTGIGMIVFASGVDYARYRACEMEKDDARKDDEANDLGG